MSLLVFVYLLVLFVFSGLSIRLGDRIGFYMVLFFPLFLFFSAYSINKKLSIPKKLGVAWFAFSIFDLIATYFSPNRELSIERFLIYQASFLAGIGFYSLKQKINNSLDAGIKWSAVIFVLAFLFKDYLLSSVRLIDTNQAFNFFYPYYPDNNHLGIWLGLVLIYLFANKKYFNTIVYLPFFILSLSRSAFVALYGVMVINLMQGKAYTVNSLIKSKKRFWILLIVVSTLFLVGVAIFIPRNTLIGHRDKYIEVALRGFRESPLIGIGPGNYVYISRQYSALTKGTFGTSSHNIFTDILSGSGIFAFVWFCVFFYLAVRHRQNNRYFNSFIYLFLCFMMTYIYLMPVMMLLFMSYLGLSYQEEENYNIPPIIPLTSIAIFLVGICLLFSEVLYLRENYEQSLKIYPYRNNAYQEMISQIPYDQKEELLTKLETYKKHFPDSFDQLNYSANIYSRMGEYEKALADYKKLYREGTGFNVYFAKEISQLYLKLNDPVAAYRFSINFIREVFDNPDKYGHMTYNVKLFCIDTYKFFLNKSECK